jgi:hypothetical protein
MKTRTAMTAVALTAGVLAACSTASGPAPQRANTPARTSSPQAPENPVPILRLTGCPVPAGEVNGSPGLDADRTASCTFPGTFGEQVWVFTYPTMAYRDNRLAHPLAPPQDYETVIRGPGASLVLVDRSPGFTGPEPQQIAARVGGIIVSGGLRELRPP